MKHIVAIPSKGRSGSVKIFKWLTKVVAESSVVDDICVFVEPNEVEEYRAKMPGYVSVVDIGRVDGMSGFSRWFIQDWAEKIPCDGEIILSVIDDDVDAIKVPYSDSEGRIKMRVATDGEVISRLDSIKARFLENVALGQLQPSTTTQAFQQLYKDAYHGRSFFWCSFPVRRLKERGVLYDKGMFLFSDFDFICQMFETGLDNVRLGEWSIQAVTMGSNKGGCQTYRNTEIGKECIERLCQKYGVDRIDVRVNPRTKCLEAQPKWRMFPRGRDADRRRTLASQRKARSAFVKPKF